MTSEPVRAPGLRSPELGVLIVLGVTAAIGLLWLKQWSVTFNDFGAEANAPLTALLHGHFAQFLKTAPAYGGSLELRAPFALAASLTGGGVLLLYRFSALPCLLAAVALGVWLAARLRASGNGWIAMLVTVAVCSANPIMYYALELGHPEELLGAVLCVVAVLAALRGHATWAGLMLGAAIGNKEWALLAIGPVLLALPAHHWKALAAATAVAALMLGPIAIASPSLASSSGRISVNDGGAIFYPQQIWWFFGTPGRWVPSMAGQLLRGYRWPPGWLTGRAHLLIVWLGLPLTLVAARRGMLRENALLLLALLLLLRCMLDPWDLIYYPLPFVIALLGWETTVRHRTPVAALAASFGAVAIFEYLPPYLSANQRALLFIIPSVIALIAVVVTVYRRPSSGVRRADQSTTSSSLVN